MIIDSAHGFANAIRMLYNLDRDVLVEAGVLKHPHPNAIDTDKMGWQAFRADPPRFVMYADDETVDKLWALMEARQRK